MSCSQEYQEFKLHPDDFPLRAQQQRTKNNEQFHLIVRKNPIFPRRRQLLPSIIESSFTRMPIDTLSNNCHKKLSYAKLGECSITSPKSFVHTTYSPVYQIRTVGNSSKNMRLVREEVKNNPAKGFGNYVYI